MSEPAGTRPARTGPDESAALAGAARVFADLFLVELDAARLAALQEPEWRSLLGDLGVAVPSDGGEEAIDELAAAYHAAFIRPDGGGAPPVGSLWTEGRFEGELATRVRQLAQQAALEFSAAGAHGAPVDHIGAMLHLWADATARAPWVADEIAEQHLGWAEACLTRTAASGPGFYPDVAAAALRLVGEIRSTRVHAPG